MPSASLQANGAGVADHVNELEDGSETLSAVDGRPRNGMSTQALSPVDMIEDIFNLLGLH